MTSSYKDVPPCQWFSRLAAFLDRRSARRITWLLLGALVAHVRTTVTSWIRAAGLSTHFRSCYTTVAAAGKKAHDIAARLVCQVVRPLRADQAQLTLACCFQSYVGSPALSMKTGPSRVEFIHEIP